MATGISIAGERMAHRTASRVTKRTPVTGRRTVIRLRRHVRLSPAERGMLPHPDWLTKDDADAITACRRRNGPWTKLQDYLRKRAHRLER
jgi:hypothetical protein